MCIIDAPRHPWDLRFDRCQWSTTDSRPTTCENHSEIRQNCLLDDVVDEGIGRQAPGGVATFVREIGEPLPRSAAPYRIPA